MCKPDLFSNLNRGLISPKCLILGRIPSLSASWVACRTANSSTPRPHADEMVRTPMWAITPLQTAMWNSSKRDYVLMFKNVNASCCISRLYKPPATYRKCYYGAGVSKRRISNNWNFTKLRMPTYDIIKGC